MNKRWPQAQGLALCEVVRSLAAESHAKAAGNSLARQASDGLVQCNTFTCRRMKLLAFWLLVLFAVLRLR